MRRTEVLQGLRIMKFEDLYTRRQARELTQEQAAEILGVSVRTLRRWEDRFEVDGARQVFTTAALSAWRGTTVAQVLELFDTRYWDYTAKHFHEKLVSEHGFTQSYNWVRLTLQGNGRIRPAPRRGAHRRKRAPRPMVGMMLPRMSGWQINGGI